MCDNEKAMPSEKKGKSRDPLQNEKAAENREYFKRALAEALEIKKTEKDAEFLAFLDSLNSRD